MFLVITVGPLPSRPAWARGLKHIISHALFIWSIVAPCVGAWIETHNLVNVCPSQLVAPCVGAWIETTGASGRGVSGESRPAWARGLKLRLKKNRKFLLGRRALRGRVD